MRHNAVDNGGAVFVEVVLDGPDPLPSNPIVGWAVYDRRGTSGHRPRRVKNPVSGKVERSEFPDRYVAVALSELPPPRRMPFKPHQGAVLVSEGVMTEDEAIREAALLSEAHRVVDS